MSAKTTQRSMWVNVLILGYVSVCAGQTSTSLISGTVFDRSGAVVTGATVTAANEGTGAALKQLTNSAGLYAFPSIQVGTYTITVELPGFKTARQNGNKLVVGIPLAIDITLEIGSAAEVVMVEASPDRLNTVNATLGNVVEAQTITTLPLNG